MIGSVKLFLLRLITKYINATKIQGTFLLYLSLLVCPLASVSDEGSENISNFYWSISSLDVKISLSTPFINCLRTQNKIILQSYSFFFINSSYPIHFLAIYLSMIICFSVSPLNNTFLFKLSIFEKFSVRIHWRLSTYMQQANK